MNEILECALKTGKVAGAYLIAGACADATKNEIDEFLQKVYCSSHTACGTCPGCLKYLHRNHADVFRIEAKNSIKIDDVRGIPAAVSEKSYEGGYKAVIIAKADSMTPQAQNALLKIIEEPPPDTVFMLGAQNVKNILPTIQSRCIILKTSFSEIQTEQQLVQEQRLPTLRARVLAHAAGGDYFLAQQYLEDDFFEARDDMVLALNRLWSAKNMATSATLALFLKHEQAIGLCLDIAIRYIADILIYKHTGKTEGIVNQDQLHAIEKHAVLSDFVLVNTQDQYFDCVVKRAQCAGLNTKLALESMLFHILEVII